jgi:hypothetical protein
MLTRHLSLLTPLAAVLILAQAPPAVAADTVVNPAFYDETRHAVVIPYIGPAPRYRIATVPGHPPQAYVDVMAAPGMYGVFSAGAPERNGLIQWVFKGQAVDMVRLSLTFVEPSRAVVRVDTQRRQLLVFSAPIRKPVAAKPPTPLPTPTIAPALIPVAVPTLAPTAAPTLAPTAAPTAKPTLAPTPVPTARPTVAPTPVPTARPTSVPTAKPTPRPTPVPTAIPTAKPTAAPTAQPTVRPTIAPTARPTPVPTPAPTAKPAARPTARPTARPVAKPAVTPMPRPIATPAAKPTARPGVKPARKPVAKPSVAPTATPMPRPTARPTPKSQPTPRPSAWPTPHAVMTPEPLPLVLPTTHPSERPASPAPLTPRPMPTQAPRAAEAAPAIRFEARGAAWLMTNAATPLSLTRPTASAELAAWMGPWGLSGSWTRLNEARVPGRLTPFFQPGTNMIDLLLRYRFERTQTQVVAGYRGLGQGDVHYATAGAAIERTLVPGWLTLHGRGQAGHNGTNSYFLDGELTLGVPVSTASIQFGLRHLLLQGPTGSPFLATGPVAAVTLKF